GVDGRGRHDLVVLDDAALKDQVVRQPAAAGAPETGADARALLRDLERRAHLRLALAEQVQPLEPVVHRHQGVEGDGVGTGPVALEVIPDLRDLPFQLRLRQGAPRQLEAEAGAGRLDERVRADLPRRRGDPQPGVGAGLTGLAVPARRAGPGVLLLPVLADRLRLRLLVPGVVRAQGVPQRVGGERPIGPRLVVGALDELLHAGVDGRQSGRDQLPVHDDARRGPAALAPAVAAGEAGVVGVRVVPDARVHQVLRPRADLAV